LVGAGPGGPPLVLTYWTGDVPLSSVQEFDPIFLDARFVG
jgi:hypothetical protein